MRDPEKSRDLGLRQHLAYLLKGGGAHIQFHDVVKRFSAGIRGVKPAGTPHTAWQLVEHMRIAQWDILEFSRNGKHVSPQWPAGYWPESEAPPTRSAWSASLREFERDLKAMIGLVSKPSTNLYARIPHGEGQTILREALLVADHNAYHLGQLASLGKMLGAKF